MNSVQLYGHIVSDIKSGKTAQGLAFANCIVAVKDSFKDQNTNKPHQTNIKVSAFGRTAETLATYFTKGAQIVIDGSLITSKWLVEIQGRKFMIPDANGGEKQAEINQMSVRINRVDFVETKERIAALRAKHGETAPAQTGAPTQVGNAYGAPVQNQQYGAPAQAGNAYGSQQAPVQNPYNAQAGNTYGAPAQNQQYGAPQGNQAPAGNDPFASNQTVNVNENDLPF